MRNTGTGKHTDGPSTKSEEETEAGSDELVEHD